MAEWSRIKKFFICISYGSWLGTFLCRENMGFKTSLLEVSHEGLVNSNWKFGLNDGLWVMSSAASSIYWPTVPTPFSGVWRSSPEKWECLLPTLISTTMVSQEQVTGHMAKSFAEQTHFILWTCGGAKWTNPEKSTNTQVSELLPAAGISGNVFLLSLAPSVTPSHPSLLESRDICHTSSVIPAPLFCLIS